MSTREPMPVNTRELILQRVRANATAPRELPPVPGFVRPAPTPAAFAAALERMGGSVVHAATAAEAAAVMRERFAGAGVVCSAVPELPGTRALHATDDPRSLHDVDIGVVRAAFGVAETGSVYLSERELLVNAIAFLSQHLVVLLDPAQIVADLHDAYRASGFRDARYAVLMSGPSATADIEGVLVHGAQGVRTLTVVLVPRADATAPAAASRDEPGARSAAPGGS